LSALAIDLGNFISNMAIAYFVKDNKYKILNAYKLYYFIKGYCIKHK